MKLKYVITKTKRYFNLLDAYPNSQELECELCNNIYLTDDKQFIIIENMGHNEIIIPIYNVDIFSYYEIL